MKKIKKLFFFFYNQRFIRYLFVGGTTFIIDEGILIFLNQRHVWLPLALVIAYTTAFAYNFSLNRWWAFSASETNSLKSHIKPYTLLFFFNLAFTIVFVSTLTHFLSKVIDQSVAVPLAKAFSIMVQMLWTYYVYKNYIFISKKDSGDAVNAAISSL